MSVNRKIDLFGKVKASSLEAANQIAAAAGFALQEEAQVNVRRYGAIDTGALLNSAYTETAKSVGSQRAAAVARAVQAGARAKKSGRSKVVMALPSTRVLADGEAKVAFAVAHAVWVHVGARGRVARPFLDDAVSDITMRVQTESAQITRRLIEGSGP